MTKVGRNDPCPCGSGKKYKKCCANKSYLQQKQTTVLSAQSAGKISQVSQKSNLGAFFHKTIAPQTETSDLKGKVSLGKPEKTE